MVSGFFFKQRTAYGLRISDWSADVCSSDLVRVAAKAEEADQAVVIFIIAAAAGQCDRRRDVETRFAERGIVAIDPLLLGEPQGARMAVDRQSVVQGTSVSVCVDFGGRRIMKKTNKPIVAMQTHQNHA